MKSLSTIQRIALEVMSEENIGSILVKGFGWVFPEHIRKSEQVAEAVIVQFFK